MNGEANITHSKIPPVIGLGESSEKEHFCKIISVFKCYRQHSLDRIDRNEQVLNSLPMKYQNLLTKYRGNLDDFRTCVHNNQQLLNLIVKYVSSMFENVQPVSNELIAENELLPELSDIDKVHTTLKQIARDWSIEGAEERQSCYDPIISEIVNNFPPSQCNPDKVKVLVPGAGLGRLTYEIVKQGYSCEGNEFSLFMLFTSNFVLNKCHGVNLYHIHPWIHQFDNNLSAKEQMRTVSFPDVNPTEVGQTNARFTMIAGDFLEIYTNEDEWDCVATCYFIDCAPNIVAFVESIYNILKPGGLWLNFGPLLYHFNNSRRPQSVELSYEDLKEVIIAIGFKFEKEHINIKSKYAQNPNSMLQHSYNSVFFVCRKPSIKDKIGRNEMSVEECNSEETEPVSEQTSGVMEEDNGSKEENCMSSNTVL